MKKMTKPQVRVAIFRELEYYVFIDIRVYYNHGMYTGLVYML